MSDPVSIEQAVLDATGKLRRVTDAPRLEAELLMARAIDMPRSFLFAHPEDELDALAEKVFFGHLTDAENQALERGKATLALAPERRPGH